jgi:hypothetical protein
MDLRTPVISLHNINWSNFITEMEGAYYAIRTESLNVIKINFVFEGFTLNSQKHSETKIQSFWVSKVILYILGRRVKQSRIQYSTLQKSGHFIDHWPWRFLIICAFLCLRIQQSRTLKKGQHLGDGDDSKLTWIHEILVQVPRTEHCRCRTLTKNMWGRLRCLLASLTPGIVKATSPG